MAGSGSSAAVFHRPRGIVRVDFTLTSDASGVVTGVDSATALYGKIVGVYKDGAAAATQVITIKDKKTGATLGVFTASGSAAAGFLVPKQLINLGTSTFGTGVAAATTSTDPYEDIRCAGPITVSMTAGGNALVTKVSVVVDEGAPNGDRRLGQNG